jgi:hypothetical protein
MLAQCERVANGAELTGRPAEASWGEGATGQGQPWAKRFMKQVKSSMLRAGAMVEPSQLA